NTLQSAGDSLYRAKGWVDCAEGPTYVDVASGRIDIHPVQQMLSEQSVIVIIGSGSAAKLVEECLSPLAC
ncbi:MAG TPA: hypothetical protein DCM28_16985, partial [Phycisphaerales bacterium]|nr:hypothetical protein [Phycisphaerales bacterium]